MKRSFTGNPQIQAVEDSARDETGLLAWLVQTPFGRVTPIYSVDCVAFLGTCTRAQNGAAVTLQAVTAQRHQSRVVVVRSCGGAAISIQPAGDGRINGIAGTTGLTAGCWGIFIVTPDADNDWLGMFVT